MSWIKNYKFLLRVIMLTLICMMIPSSFIAKPKSTVGHTTKNPSLAKIDPSTKFNEIWPILVKRHPSALADTPAEREVCFQKILAAGLSHCLNDPHSYYMTKEAAAALTNEMIGSYAGVGLELTDVNIHATIVNIFDESPAAESGQFQSGDVIIEVNGENMSLQSTSVIAKKIIGPVDTVVTIRVERDGVKHNPVTLKRAIIVVHSVMAQDIDDDITYIRISDFLHRMPREFLRETILRIGDVSSSGNIVNPRAKKFVYDVRKNPGGLLAAAAMASYFFSDNPNHIIVTMQSRDGAGAIRVADFSNNSAHIPFGILKDVKAAILIDEQSASASEIFAQFVHEATGAPRIGKTSFGKGSVQEVIPLNNGDALHLTIAEYFVGNKKTAINDIGIKPEIEVEAAQPAHDSIYRSHKHVDPNNDPQLKKAIEWLRTAR